MADGSCMKQEPPIERLEALRDAPVFGSSPFGGISSQGARPDALTKCASKSLGFARVDQIRCTELLSKRSCPNLPACGWSFQNTRKTARRRIKGRVAKWIALDAPKRRSYGKSTVPLEQKREGRLRRKKRDTQLQCAILMLAICVLPIAADDSCSSNLHNEQSCYYRQANWNSFFGHPRELEFLH